MSHTISQTIHLSQAGLTTHLNISRDEAQFEVQLLLQHALKVNRAWLIAHASDILQESVYEAFEALFKRRLNGEPIAYILGYREFFGLQLKVSVYTLIPRPDTEVLVETALGKIPANHPYDVLDLGTGSGAIALAVAHSRSKARITAIDASPEALNIAIENAANLNISNTQFIVSDWFNVLSDQQFDLILSNPPYIKQHDEHLKQGDLRFEPLSALISGEDGFDDIRRIIRHSQQYLKSNGWLMLEHGYDQGEYVAELLTKNGFDQVSHVKDLAGIPRVTIGCYVAT